MHGKSKDTVRQISLSLTKQSIFSPPGHNVTDTKLAAKPDTEEY